MAIISNMGGVDWADKLISGVFGISGGLSGNLATVTCDADERVVLTMLWADGDIPNTTVSFGGVGKITGQLIGASGGASLTGSFRIGQSHQVSNASTITQDSIIGGSGAVMVISRPSSSSHFSYFAYKIQKKV